MKKGTIVLVVFCLLFLAGCEQSVPLQLTLPNNAQRDVFQISTETFVQKFNQTVEKAGLPGRTIGELKKSEAGIYDRYTYSFDDYNDIILDCIGEERTVSALYLVNKNSENGSGEGNASGDFGAFLPVIIHVAADVPADTIEDLLESLGITTVRIPQNGFYQDTQKDNVHYQLSVEKDTITFAMAALAEYKG